MSPAVESGDPQPVDTAEPINVSAHLQRAAQLQPDKRAIVFSAGLGPDGRMQYSHLTFAELDQETDRFAHGLEKAGIGRGMRTILMVRPSRDFFVLTFALYKIGAVPVLIDPGMGRRRMVECLAAVKPEAFIGIPLAHLLRILHRSSFRSVRVNVTVGRRCCWGGFKLRDVRETEWRPYTMAPTDRDDPAAIIFTTGSTGPSKGVLYRHGMFDAQVRILRDHFNIQPDEIDLPTFPLFALFDPALGMTAVIPDMDPTRPAEVDPTQIIRAIEDQGVTHMFGSPALLNRVGRFGEAEKVQLPTLRRVITAGAPAPAITLQRFSKMLSDQAQVYTPYGATEALPVTSIGSHEILGETASASSTGKGTCVGRPVPGITLRIIGITEDPIRTWSDERLLPVGEIGEVCVKGPVVTREYLTSDTANALHKIGDSDGIWHRMGDVGRLDEQGRLWFCGRKAHRVVTRQGTLYTVPCEAIFNEDARVFRSALVGLGEKPDQRPVICIELEQGIQPSDTLRRELLERGASSSLTQSIHTVLFHPKFPVDIRHNAKIFREKLAVWAESTAARRGPK